MPLGPQRPHLIDVEARVLGVLIEKALTTPDNYPLSINAAVNGCNQKSNREPVTSFLEAEVAVGLGGLVQKHLAGRVIGAGSRVEKWRHTAHETLQLDDARLAVLAELMMRGPQVPGELRARVHRMVETPSQSALMVLLDDLLARGFVERLAPVPGGRAERYVQLLTTASEPGEAPQRSVAPAAASGTTAAEPPVSSAAPAAPLDGRVESLEREVTRLRALYDELADQLGVRSPSSGE